MVSYDFGSSTWRNITQYATKGDSGSRNTTESSSPPLLRADSTLTYVPNLGTDNRGVLVSIGVSVCRFPFASVRPGAVCSRNTLIMVLRGHSQGGNDDQMMDNSILDVYDIGAGAFVKQATQGDIMTPRVNHCAVRGRLGALSL